MVDSINYYNMSVCGGQVVHLECDKSMVDERTINVLMVKPWNGEDQPYSLNDLASFLTGNSNLILVAGRPNLKCIFP